MSHPAHPIQLFANIPELQPHITQLLTHITQLLANVAIIFTQQQRVKLAVPTAHCTTQGTIWQAETGLFTIT